MIPKISRGNDSVGLVSYLVGEGKTNEHTDPTFVAGSSNLGASYANGVALDSADVKILGGMLKPIYGKGQAKGGVWHCSLSLAPDDRPTNIEAWERIAVRFMNGMGFQTDPKSREAVTWVAVHHGLSKNGNNHIHIAVNLIQENGKWARIHNDAQRAQNLCREIEVEFKLNQLGATYESRRGVSYKELFRLGRDRAEYAYNQNKEQGAPEFMALSAKQKDLVISSYLDKQKPRLATELSVRSALAVSSNERGFVAELQRMNLSVRPRFNQVGDKVTGYEVAINDGMKPEIWFSATKLSKDLWLSSLREKWAEKESTPEVWRVAEKGGVIERPVLNEIENKEFKDLSGYLSRSLETLQRLPNDDLKGYATYAHYLSNTLAHWSKEIEGDTPGKLGKLSESLGSIAQVRGNKAELVSPNVGKDAMSDLAGIARFSPGQEDPEADMALAEKMTMSRINAVFELVYRLGAHLFQTNQQDLYASLGGSAREAYEALVAEFGEATKELSPDSRELVDELDIDEDELSDFEPTDYGLNKDNDFER